MKERREGVSTHTQKKRYVSPRLKTHDFCLEDIITASQVPCKPVFQGGGGGPEECVGGDAFTS